MKKYNIYFIILYLTIGLFLPSTDAQSYTTWGLPDGAVVRLGKGEITGNIAFSPDSNRLAVASSIGIWIYDVRPGQVKELDLLIGHTRQVTAIAFSPDGNTLVSGSKDETIRLWDVVLGREKTKLAEQQRAITSIAFSPDGNILATANGLLGSVWDIKHEIRLWNLQTGEHTSLVGHTNDITSVAFSPDGKTLASSSKDRTVYLWNVATGKSTLLLPEHEEDIIYVGYSPDGKTIATGSRDNKVKLWDATTGIPKTTIKENDGRIGITSVTYSPDGKMIATGGRDFMRLWEADTGQYITAIKPTGWGDGEGIVSVVFSPDGNTLATASEHNLNLWDL